MPRYNFSEISDFEFEELCRDLMQEALGLSLELFAPGRDQGIDFRHVGFRENDVYTIVGQCKRWAQDSFSALLRQLVNEELPKIKRLTPNRYILMTSVELTPARKSQIVTALDPWVKSPQDIKGRDDITGLLARYPEIERRHIKLWLTSGEVLDALLSSDIANRSDSAVAQAKRQLRLWVPNPSFDRALDVLERNRVCIISGSPGIGKTMLADVLFAGYVSRGYQPIAISEDIEEGIRALQPERRQIFLYDDFLGHVTYGELHLRKNEPSDLARFLRRVRDSRNKRLILTTREYILSEAVSRYEGFPDSEITSLKNVVSLEDYTESVRARILYNHLFFSKLPQDLKTALLIDKKYWEVIRHANYSPRVIEHAVDLADTSNITPVEFVDSLIATLADPRQVWQKIFNNLSLVARRVLQALASLPTEVFLSDVLEVVKNLSPNDFDPGEFNNALRTLEGTFINIDEASPGTGHKERLVTIRDPSVRDYLWSRLQHVDGEADMLLASAIFFEQCVILYEGRNHANDVPPWLLIGSSEPTRARDVVDHEEVAVRSIDLISSPTALVRKIGIGRHRDVKRASINLELRVSFLISILAECPDNQVVAEAAIAAMEMVTEKWESRDAFPRIAVRIMSQAVTIEGGFSNGLLRRAEEAVFTLVTERLSDIEDFEPLVGLANLDTDFFGPCGHSLKSWAPRFEAVLDGERDWLLEDQDDPDQLDQVRGDIQDIAEALGVDASDLIMSVDERIEDLRDAAEPDFDDDMPQTHSKPEEVSDEEGIDALFESLR